MDIIKSPLVFEQTPKARTPSLEHLAPSSFSPELVILKLSIALLHLFYLLNLYFYLYQLPTRGLYSLLG